MVTWLLATPDSYRSVALRFGVVPGTLHYFYKYVIEALRELSSKFISWRDQEERRQIQEILQRATGFPGVVGCIDGTHVYIPAPVLNPSNYMNRHHTHSINVQAVVDCNLLVRDIHVGEVGSMHDDRVFRRSPLAQRLIRGEGLSPDKHLVGDGVYTLTNFMMISFANNGHLIERQNKFNKRLSQSRVRVENSLASTKGKWRRLKYLASRNQALITDHIIVSFVLHNFIILYGEPIIPEDELARPINNNEVLGNGPAEGQGNEEVHDHYEEQLYMVKVMGAEKRAFIMNDVLADD